jgi:ribosomal protein S18 acetylase RimI-like enzyme
LHIESFIRPGLKTFSSVRELESVCKAHDGLAGSLSFDPTLNFSPDIPSLFALYEDETLAGACILFAPAKDEAEISALTHPAYRGRGVFRALAVAAAKSAEQFGIPDLLFLCEPKSAAGLAALAAYGVTLDHMEYCLRFDGTDASKRLDVPAGLALQRAAVTDLPDMARISAESFSEDAERALHFLELAVKSDTRVQYLARFEDSPAAIGAVGYSDGEATIYGLGVLPCLQGKGIGRGIIALLLQEISTHGEKEILIEVDSTNTSALHLYRSCGFAAEATYGYYRAPVDRVLAHHA